MCESIERLKKQERILGIIGYMLKEKKTEIDIKTYILENFDVEAEYVEKLISDTYAQKQ